MWECIPRTDPSRWSGGKEWLTVGVSRHIYAQSPWSTFQNLTGLYSQHQIKQNCVKLGSETFILALICLV